jgi:hypothetical protein
MQYLTLTKYNEIPCKYGHKATLILLMTKSERHFLPNCVSNTDNVNILCKYLMYILTID